MIIKPLLRRLGKSYSPSEKSNNFYSKHPENAANNWQANEMQQGDVQAVTNGVSRQPQMSNSSEVNAFHPEEFIMNWDFYAHTLDDWVAMTWPAWQQRGETANCAPCLHTPCLPLEVNIICGTKEGMQIMGSRQECHQKREDGR